MGQRSNENDAAMKDAPIKSNEEECAGGMEHTATLTKNPLLLHELSKFEKTTA